MTTLAVLSTNEVRDYIFSTPITALFWRLVIGYEPLVLMCETREWWADQPERCRIALRALEHWRIDHRFVGHVEGYETARVGQNAREHAAVYADIEPETWLIVSDADLWPLSAEYHRRLEAHRETMRAVCLNANLDGFTTKEITRERIEAGVRFQTIPTCCVAMRARDWRDRYAMTAGEPAHLAVKRTMDDWVSRFVDKRQKEPRWRAFDLWMMDQDVVTERLVSAPWFDDACLRIARPENGARLDRGSWDEKLLGSALDAHVFNAPDREDNWQRLRRVIQSRVPQILEWADAYRAEFRGSYVD